MLTPAQQEQRLAGITATDIAAILSQHPYRSRIDVWREKRGESAPYVDTDRSEWGQLLEPVIRADYERRRSCRVIVPSTLRHGDNPWMQATPDGLVYSGETAELERGLEIKCHTTRLWHLYGNEGTDEVPPHELCQCMWGMAVTGLPQWDLVAFIDGLPRSYTIERDDELIAIMIDSAERFMRDNLEGGQQPEPDGTEQYTKYLRDRWASNNNDLVDIGEDLETFELIEKGKRARDEIGDREAMLEVIEQTLKNRIGDRAGLTWRDAKGKPLKLTWRRGKQQRSVDYKSIVVDMKHTAALASSAKRPEVEHALESLRTHDPGKWIGGPSVKTAPSDPRDIAKVIVEMRDALEDVAKNVTEPQHTETFSTRPFFWPSQWNETRKAKEQ